MIYFDSSKKMNELDVVNDLIVSFDEQYGNFNDHDDNSVSDHDSYILYVQVLSNPSF